ncbi:MAG: SH3 domain-containing protein [Sciscionella sp.]
MTGFCLPRWVSLKSDDVDGRKGPGKDYPALYVYHARGLPVQIVEETTEWRRICDPDGGAVWVDRSMIDGRRTMMAAGPGPATMRRAAGAEAPSVGLLRPRALAAMGRCQAGWCKVSAQGHSGWVAAGELWGAADAAACR